jgi:hypothetical protein
LSKATIVYVGLMVAMAATFFLVRPAGDPNPGVHGIIRVLLHM